jgi:hypothetical protein
MIPIPHVLEVNTPYRLGLNADSRGHGIEGGILNNQDITVTVLENDAADLRQLEQFVASGMQIPKSLQMVSTYEVQLDGSPHAKRMLNAALYLAEALRLDQEAKQTQYDAVERLIHTRLGAPDYTKLLMGLLNAEPNFPQVDRRKPVVIQSDESRHVQLRVTLPHAENSKLTFQRVAFWGDSGDGLAETFRVRAPMGGGRYERVWSALFVLLLAMSQKEQGQEH